MAISTYAELITALDNWLIVNYNDERLNEFIALGEAEINRRLINRGGIRDMETSASLSLTAGTRTVSLPTRFLGARRLYLDTSPITRLEFMPPVDYWGKFVSSDTSKPAVFTFEADDVLFGPIPDTTYTGRLLYFQGFAPITSSNTTGDLLTNAPDVYLYAALKQAWIFKGDAPNEVTTYESLLEGVINQLISANKRDRFGGAPLVVRTDVSKTSF